VVHSNYDYWDQVGQFELKNAVDCTSCYCSVKARMRIRTLLTGVMVCHSRTCFRRCKLVPAKAGSGYPDLRMVLDSTPKPALSKAEWVRNDKPQSMLDKALPAF